MSDPKCLITGVTLLHDGLAKPADLFILGDHTFIVNASGEGYPHEPYEGEKIITIPYDAPLFERRNVYVVPAWPFFLNREAQEYIAKAP